MKLVVLDSDQKVHVKDYENNVKVYDISTHSLERELDALSDINSDALITEDSITLP